MYEDDCQWRIHMVGRKWHPLDVVRLAGVVILHLMCLLAPFHFTRSALWVSVSLSVITLLLGITLSYHRNLTHRSFTLPKWLEYTFAYCGLQAIQGDPIFWVSTHRYHHQFTDTSRDPHSPNEGFWFSHINWIFDKHYRNEKYGKTSNVNDLSKQAFYRFLNKTHVLHLLALGFLLYFSGGMPFLVWGMGVRAVVILHITFLVNSVCHIWGKQPWNTGDDSRNNWWVALLTYGEGWHNNHHAFPNSARHGLEWWQVDMTWGVIRLLETLGLATNVKLPNEGQKKKVAWSS
ncbi:unnamed protein product [Rhodiola kirilowii]